MGAFGSVSFGEILARGSLRETDIAKLSAIDARQLTPDDVQALFALHVQCLVKDVGWSDWFIGIVSDYVVHTAEPQGYLTEENAQWLIDQAARSGWVETRTELDLLIDVLESARWVPRSLIAFGLSQVRRAVVAGDGPLRPGQPRALGLLFDEEIEIMRRMIYAFGGDGSMALTRSEVEILFDINAALDKTRINTAWTELFVKAVTNVMLAASGYGVPTREEALRSEAWHDERSETTPEAIVNAIVKSGLDGVVEAYRVQTPVEQALSRLEREYRNIITGEDVTSDDASWLTEWLGRSDALTMNEIALVDYLAKVPVTVEPELQEVLERVHTAA